MLPVSVPFEMTVPLRWTDFDALGHVTHVAYLGLASEARDRFMEAAVGSAYLSLVVARIEIDYRVEIPIGVDRVTVRCRVESLGESSIRTREQVVRPDGEISAELLTVSVLRDEESRRARALSDAERQALLERR